MARIEKTVFISYRRKDISWALAVYQYLTSQIYDVFFDFSSMASGDFEQIIVSNIKARAHFVLILTPTALDRCSEPGDWLRREIETAVYEKRNIIPLFFDGFSFGLPSVVERLTGSMSVVRRYNGLDVPAGYFMEAMARLDCKYLNVPLDAVIHPVSNEVRKAVEDEQVAADNALLQKRDDIEELVKSAEERTEPSAEKEVQEEKVIAERTAEWLATYHHNAEEFRKKEEKSRRALARQPLDILRKQHAAKVQNLQKSPEPKKISSDFQAFIESVGKRLNTSVNLRNYTREIETLVNQGQLNEAIAHCQHILRNFPKYLEVYRLIGKAFLESQLSKDAIDIFSRILVVVPDDFNAHVGMSILRENESKLDDAIWHMERAFETQPSNAAIQGELQRLYGRRDGVQPRPIRMTRGALAYQYMQGNLYPQAIAEIRGVLKDDPGRSDMQALLARAYFLSGQKKEAAEVASAMLRRYPYALDANRVLAEILGAENTENAQIYRRRLIELDPYAAYVTDTVFNSYEVNDDAISLIRLKLD